MKPDGGRWGDPIADYMMCRRFPQDDGEVILFSGADGSGWGQRSARAAQDVSTKFAETVVQALGNEEGVNDIQELTGLLIDAIAAGHREIEAHCEETGGGFTTHLGFVGKVDSEGLFRGVMTTVGDQKLFILRANGQVEDMTKGNRGNITSLTDPGGQLGGEPLGADMHLYPDLRNLTVYFLEAQKGDILLPMSDGIHDNLDPQYAGEPNPKAALERLLENPELFDADRDILEEIQKNMPDYWGEEEEAWAIKETPELVQLKEIYQAFQLKAIVANSTEVSTALVKYAYELTAPLRTYDEANPTQDRFMKDADPSYPKFGKQDHLSCAAITI